MGEVILITEIPRESDTLYYCSTDENGMIMVCKAKMNHGGRKKKGNKK